MNATIIARTPTSFTLQVEIPYNGSMLDFEETLQQRLNEAGVVATAEGLKPFDTDGSPIIIGSVKLTTKGPVEKDYQTPYGVATIARHVYQSPQGGPTYCPLDRDARIVVSSTPQDLRISLGCLGAPGMSDLPLLSSPARRESDGFCTIDHQEISTSSGTSAP